MHHYMIGYAIVGADGPVFGRAFVDMPMPITEQDVAGIERQLGNQRTVGLDLTVLSVSPMAAPRGGAR